MTTLTVKPRTILGKKTRTLRSQGSIPGVIYGHGLEPTPVVIDKLAFDKVYRQAGESTLLDLVVEGGKASKVIIQDVQFHPVSGTVQHVDFHQVRMDEKLVVDIPLKFVGEAPAVKELGGILIKNVDHFKAECLPQDLVHEIEIDLSKLAEFNKGLQLKDIKIPTGIKVILPPEEVVAIVTPPRSEAELAELKSEVKEDVSAVESTKPEKAKEEGVETVKSKAESEKPEKKDK